jgi:hypothetical protein
MGEANADHCVLFKKITQRYMVIAYLVIETVVIESFAPAVCYTKS